MLGIFGGTFDPIHYGHLRIAQEILQNLDLSAVSFVPVAQPPHRQNPVASSEQRVAMVRAAIATNPAFLLDVRETQRAGPSYMIDTVKSIATENPNVTLCLILGQDAFSHLHLWHLWRELFNYVHVAVATRPGYGHNFSDALSAELKNRQVNEVALLKRESAGRIIFCPVTSLDISSTKIRQLVGAEKRIFYLVPDSVEALIDTNRLYRQ